MTRNTTTRSGQGNVSTEYARVIARRHVTLASSAVAGLLFAGAAQAATLTVNTADDNTAEDDVLTLREAIAVVNDGDPSDGVTDLGGRDLTAQELAQIDDTEPFGTSDTILFDAALNGTPLMITGGQFTMSAARTTPLTLTGNGAANTVLDAGQMSRFFHVPGPGAGGGSLVLQGLTLQNGRVLVGHGGAFFFSDDSTRTLILQDSVLSGNSATGGGDGGAIRTFSGSVTVTNSTLSGNSTSTGVTTGDGGAISTFGGSVTVANSTLSGNSVTGDNASGGAIRTFVGTVTVTNSTLSDNSATETFYGGGAISTASGTVTVTNSTLSGNSTAGNNSEGGAIWIDDGDVTLINSTLTNNSAGDRGGAIAYFQDSSLGSLTLHNTIIAGNTGDTAPDIDEVGTLTASHSLIGDNSGTSLTEAPVGMPDANDNLIGGPTNGIIDPLLDPLAFNGGPTQTHALLDTSPAIDVGDNALAVDPVSNPLTTDQRGAPRIINTTVDMGAYEDSAEFDLGDAPDADPQDPDADPPQSYPTLLANNGAAHLPGGPALGTAPDTEADGQPTAEADGDDMDMNGDDEDGVFFASAIEADNDATVDVTVSNGPGLLNAWIDFNADGDWDDEGEQIFTDETLMDGSNTGLSFAVPVDAMAGESFARFRISDGGAMIPTGSTPRGVLADGEVEDYKVILGPQPTVMFNNKKDNPRIREKKGTFTVKRAVLLSPPSNVEVTVDIIFDAGASEAEIPADFNFSPTTVTFAPGETRADVEITIVDDGVDEGDEIAAFNLANPSNAILGDPVTFQATLKDPKKGGGGGSSGGCTLGPVAPFDRAQGERNSRPIDPLLPLLMLLAAGYLGRRRSESRSS